MIPDLKILILAGGFATRLWPLTEKRAKPLLPLAGKPLIVHTIEKIPPEIPLIIATNKAFRHDFDVVKKTFPQRSIEVMIEESEDEKTKVGALAAISMVLETTGKQHPLMVLAGDNLFSCHLEQLIHAFTGGTILAAYDTKSLEKAKSFGVVTAQDKKLQTFEEKPQRPNSSLVSTGCYIFSPAHLSLLKTFSKHSSDHLGKFFEFLLQEKEPVDVFTFEEPWFDIGSFESYLKAHEWIMQGKQHVSDRSLVVESTLQDAVDIAEGCTVKKSLLSNVMLLPGSEIIDCQLRNCIIDENCRLSGIDLNQKMIRAGTTISLY